MKAEISTWLSADEKNYKEGLALLQPLIRNRYLLKQLSKKESKSNLAKLIYELNKHLGHAPIAKKQIPPPQLPHPAKEIKQAPPPEAINQDKEKKSVEKLEIALGKMHNKKGILSNKLRSFSANDNKGRRSTLKQIDGLNEDMNSIRGKLDYYHKNGRLPPLEETPTKKEKTIPENPLEMKQMLLNLRTSRTKINKFLINATNPAEISKLKNRLQEKISFITEIERRLNAD